MKSGRTSDWIIGVSKKIGFVTGAIALSCQPSARTEVAVIVANATATATWDWMDFVIDESYHPDFAHGRCPRIGERLSVIAEFFVRKRGVVANACADNVP
jgi:hypothetical protein